MQDATIVAELKRIPLFAKLDEHTLASLSDACQWRRVPARRPVILQGDVGNSVFVIIEGRVEISRLTPEGEDVFLAERGPEQHFGEMSLLDGAPRSANVTTLTDCRFLVLDRGMFFHVLRSNSELAVAVIMALAERLREADSQRGSRDSVRDKLLAYLRREIERQTGGTPYKGAEVKLGLSRVEIAERLATSRESVSRELSALAAQGAIVVNGRGVKVLRPEKLQ